MSQVLSLPTFFSRRVPIYVSAPIVVACGAVGFVAGHHDSPAPQSQRFEVSSKNTLATSTLTAPTLTELEPAADVSKPQATEILPVRPMDETMPAAEGTPSPPPSAHDETKSGLPLSPARVATNEGKSAPTEQRKSTRPVQSRRYMAKARPVTPATKKSVVATGGLKNVPILGPVFSLFQ